MYNLIGDGLTSSRCGPLLADDVEDEQKAISSTKPHESIDDAIQYVEYHVGVKLKKGYQFLEEKEKLKSSNLFAEAMNSEDSLGKRITRENSEISAPEPERKKKVHLNAKEEEFSLKISLEADPISWLLYKARAADRDEPEEFKNDTLQKLEAFKPQEIQTQRQSQIQHPNQDQDQQESSAISRLLARKGFKGTYLTRKSGQDVEFYKVQLLRRYLKVEKGIEGDLDSSNLGYFEFKCKEEVVGQVKVNIENKISEGFVITHEKFVYKFEKEEIPSIKEKKEKALKSEHPEQRPKKKGRPKKEYIHKAEAEELKSIIQVQDDNKDSIQNSSKVESVAQEEDPFLNIKQENILTYDSLARPLLWENQDPTGWYMSVKATGIRCLWNGNELWSLQGTKYNPPEFFIENFPRFPLDGILQNKEGPLEYNIDWHKLKFIVYDQPGDRSQFNKRLETLQNWFGDKSLESIGLARYQMCQSKEHLINEQAEVRILGGEGIFVKDPEGVYNSGMTANFLEIKIFVEKEAQVIGYEWKGDENEQQIKLLKVKDTETEIEFSIWRGVNKLEIPPLGSIIVYKYSGEIQPGKPHAPVMVKAKLAN